MERWGHIFDSLEKYKAYHDPHITCADGKLAANENIGCAVVTTGPGCTNAITGLMGAWQDLFPAYFYLAKSGQTTLYGKPVRQVGTQEVNIIDIVKPLCKYSKFIQSANDMKELKKAIKISLDGRSGPVWLDIPLELQWSEVTETEKLRTPVYLPGSNKADYPNLKQLIR